MRYSILSLALFSFSFIGCVHQGNKQINGSMEQLDSLHSPVGWDISGMNVMNKAYSDALDSTVKQDGKYSISIAKKNNDSKFGTVKQSISKTFYGSEIELKAYLKTENVTGGFAGLWMRIDGVDNALAFDNMQTRGIKGTTGWKEYSIKLAYDDDKAKKIVFGALLVGGGKIWVDNLRLYIDGKPIDDAKTKTIKELKAVTDTAFQFKSSIDTVNITNQQITNLTLLCQVWGFLKYHHPAIATGNYNMDAELFRVLPAVTASRNNAELSDNIEKWVNKFGTPELCVSCRFDTTNVAEMPDYGSIFNQQLLKPSLITKLKYILNNRPHYNALSNNHDDGYYARTVYGIGNVDFKNELAYNGMQYPDAGYRLLCLFRYWNMIQYFFPYKHLIGADWNKILPQYIPRFVKASNNIDYTLTTLALIAEVHDTHANIWSPNLAFSTYIGDFMFPFTAKFIENKLVVTGYYIDSAKYNRLIKPGDVITKINGKAIGELVKRYLPITPASNYSTQLRDMPRTYLLRTREKAGQIEIITNGKQKKVKLNTINITGKQDYYVSHKKPYSVLTGNIGYIYPGKYKKDDLPKIEEMFKGTKGIIVDMRCYPSDFMPYTFVPFVKTGIAPFVLIAHPDIYNPGLFKYGTPTVNKGADSYKGKVVVIVNEVTQSQAEFTTMAFQSSPNVTVIGSTTAGADGDVEMIMLPGGIRTMISGLDIRYPDGTETQRKGVKINYVIKPTIKGIKQGRDELLDKAVEIIDGK